MTINSREKTDKCSTREVQMTQPIMSRYIHSTGHVLYWYAERQLMVCQKAHFSHSFLSSFNLWPSSINDTSLSFSMWITFLSISLATILITPISSFAWIIVLTSYLPYFFSQQLMNPVYPPQSYQAYLSKMKLSLSTLFLNIFWILFFFFNKSVASSNSNLVLYNQTEAGTFLF